MKMSPGTTSHAGADVEIRLLGTPAVLSRGDSLTPGSRKATALLAYLAMRPDEPTSRDHLAGLLWADSSNNQARANLRQALTQIRRVFRSTGIDPVKTQGDTVTLCGLGIVIDAYLLSKADSLPTSGNLRFDKEFMEGFSLAEPEFEQWQTAQKETLRGRLRELHERAADEAIEHRHIDKAIGHLTSALNLDPLQEHVHRRLMTLFAAQGRADAAMAQYERCRSVLMHELGVGPEKETKDLLKEIGLKRSDQVSEPSRHRATLGDSSRSTATPPPMVSDKPSIAVLAFENMSGDPKQEYFSDGVVEDIITDLSKINGLFVIARNSSFAYKGMRHDIRDVCRELGVRYALEGSVRRMDSRVRITAQLIDGVSGGHVWAERYDRELDDIFEVQDEVTKDIVSALALKLTSKERDWIYRRNTDNLDAYEYFLRGRDQAFRDTVDANAQACTLLEKAIELDPEFSLAYSHLSRNHVIAYVNRWNQTPDKSIILAMELAERAVALDHVNPHAHFAVSAAALWMKQHARAAEAAAKCLAIEPSFAEGHAVLGLIHVYSGMPEEAIASLHRAMRLDPHYRDIYLHLEALAHVQLEEYEQAVAVLKRRLVRKPESDISRVLLAATYGHIGEIEKGRAEWAEALRINPNYSLEHRRKILPYKDPANFEQIVEGLKKAGLPA